AKSSFSTWLPSNPEAPVTSVFMQRFLQAVGRHACCQHFVLAGLSLRPSQAQASDYISESRHQPPVRQADCQPTRHEACRPEQAQMKDRGPLDRVEIQEGQKSGLAGTESRNAGKGIGK